MKVLIDTNVILDVLEYRLPHYEASKQMLMLCEQGAVEGYVSGLSFANIVYIMRKKLDAVKIEQIHNALGEIFTFVDLTADDISEAVRMRWGDFEDALQAASAKRIKADGIITRNVKDFECMSIASMTPADFLKIV